MYSKDELSDKNTSELQDIATNLDIDVQDNTNNEELVYAILDRQAEVEGNKNPLGGTKRRRTRIVKKDTDKVYTVNGSEGENFDVKKNKVAATNTEPTKVVEPETTTSNDETLSLEELTAKNNGRLLIIILNGRIIYAPIIDTKLSTGQFLIPSGITKEETQQLQNLIQTQSTNNQ
jgi:transcription termination factor Rho